MTVLPLLFSGPPAHSGAMDTFVTVIAIIGLFALLLATPVTWWLKDRAIDRQIARAERSGALDQPVAALWSELPRSAWSRDTWALTNGGPHGAR
jgi:hypothetical protein